MDIAYGVMPIDKNTNQHSLFSPLKGYSISSGIIPQWFLQPLSAQCCDIFFENELIC